MSGVVQAYEFTDDFNTPHDYLAYGTIGTDWDGVIGRAAEGETANAIQADMEANHPNELYIQSTGGQWQPDAPLPLGPFLYKEVAGDFIATVHVTDFAGTLENRVLHNDSCIMVRVADLGAAGAGEDFECVHYFPTWVANEGRDMDDSTETEWGFIGMYWEGDDTYALAQEYLQLERVGNIFYFRISEDGENWTSLDTSGSPFNVDGQCIERPDLDGLPLQVGLAHATYSDATGYVAFDDFELLYAVEVPHPYASSSVPADGATGVNLNVVLMWKPGDFVQDVNSHEVYFGTDEAAVTDANTTSHPGVDLYIVNDPCKALGTLPFGTQYFWRVDEVNEQTRWPGEVWSFTTETGKAMNPFPIDEAESVDPNIVLSWSPGPYAVSHDVYFGTDYNDVNDANTSSNVYKGNQSLDANNFDPCGLELAVTYYWRIDEVNDSGMVEWRGDVWSFTTNWEWTYDGGTLVGAYYYPWYGPGAGGHGFHDTLRDHLVPKQGPALGYYNNKDPNVIVAHIDQSHRANIHFWAVSWWGPGTFEDNVFKNTIFTNKYAGKLKYAIMYESVGRLGANYSNLLPDFQYFADNYFNNVNYLKIDGKPVVFIYLTRVYFRGTEGYQALADLRAAFPNLYIVADDIFGPGYSSSYASKWDAVTAYDVYGQTLQPYGSTQAALNRLENILSDAKTAANSVNVGLVPFATPGFNDKAVREGHDVAPRYFEDDAQSVEGDLFRAMLRDVVVPYVDPLAENILMITSFNEWHEDTQIEPTAGTVGTTTQDDSGSGTDYTQGYYYTDYGNLYLDILRQATCFLVGDLNQNCRVDLNDFAFFASYWLDTGCGMCGGADLDDDEDVGFNDLKKLVDNWLAGTE